MESNGKRVASDGTTLPFATGEINFGEPGTSAQHSFFQLLHQGRTVPIDFLGFVKPHTTGANDEEKTCIQDNHDELMANFFAQADALAVGKTLEEVLADGVAALLAPHKVFPGNRPSTSILFGQLSPYTVGQILSLLEHRTMVQGFVWGINSFDQWGVQLGKVLGKRIRSTITEMRAKKKPTNQYNSSTTSMLDFYMQNS
jgi:glucose-6-phosphate isomerase